MFTVCGMLKRCLFTGEAVGGKFDHLITYFMTVGGLSPSRKTSGFGCQTGRAPRTSCRSPWSGCSRQLGRCPTCRCPTRRPRFLQRSSPRCLTEGLSGRGLLLRPARCGHRKLRKQLSKKLKRLLAAAPDPGADGTANEGSIRPGTRETTHQQRAKGCSKRRCRTAAPTWSRTAKGPIQR